MASHHEIMDFIENIRGEIPPRLHSIYEEAVDKALEQQNKRGKDFARKIIETNPLIRREFEHQQQEEGILAIFVLAIGFLAGAAAMYLFDPERGEQRRASLLGQVYHAADQVRDDANHSVGQVRDEATKVVGNISETVKKTADQADKTVNNASDSLKDGATQVRDSASKAVSSASSTVKEATNQAAGAAASAAVSDATLMTKVRAEVAKDVRAPGSIEVTVNGGVVTLKGQVQASEVKGLVTNVQALSGVKSVDNLLEVHDATPSAGAPSGAGSAPGNNGTPR